ncbi:DNA-binding NtrC family response regulator [Desulfosalsimonas propionicica]|uniref:DNA-binding transcriptional regulator NtrC n=1 Tax=Desulfosalsimonas propionicica TaxID=332175 RepID=A0A7W0C9L9_9BACT|nr:sigma-54 dependent transcriptional regulator [Desulfosalsimonas propionicica]MBA2881714.1 DNA-binding NtrC family response regulator [Desulfosalsimonas propionicica]
MDKILLIDDDEGLIHFLSRFFQRKGYGVTACASGRQAIETIGQQDFDLILLDYKMPDFNGLDTLSEIRAIEVKTPVILMTAYGTTNLAIEAMKRGAYDYLVKPFEKKDLTRIVSEALQVSRQMKQIVLFPAPSADQQQPADNRDSLQMIGSSRQMQEIYKLIGQVAEKDVPVLITGESGTGKELAARAIYHHSRRREKPFIAVNCAAIPESLFESELFGHERGAFTGAERTHIGKFERCHKGTLFLDEIGEMSPPLQAKLLRALQTGEIERLGSGQPITVDVRIIAATNKDLEAEVRAGRFREDLYWRLKVISLELPALRHRKQDISELVKYFLARFAEEYDRPGCYVSESALRKLNDYFWPGNVRELENCVRRAVLLCTGGVISEGSLLIPNAEADAALQNMNREQLIERLKEKLEEILPDIFRISEQDIHANIIEIVEETLIRKALEECGNNQVKAAEMLGISRNTLRHRIKKQTQKENQEPKAE